jgi:hypothetical protein
VKGQTNQGVISLLTFTGSIQKVGLQDSRSSFKKRIERKEFKIFLSFIITLKLNNVTLKLNIMTHKLSIITLKLSIVITMMIWRLRCHHKSEIILRKNRYIQILHGIFTK